MAVHPAGLAPQHPALWQLGLLLLPWLVTHTVTIQLSVPVDPEGFEPSTSSMPLRRAPNCAMGPSRWQVDALHQIGEAAARGRSSPRGNPVVARRLLGRRGNPIHLLTFRDSTVAHGGCQCQPFLLVSRFRPSITA